MLERMVRRTRIGGWRAIGAGVLAIGLAVPLSGCDEGNPLGEMWAKPPAAAPDYDLSVDCGANPADSQQAQAVQTRMVRIARLSIAGPRYADTWRLQLFPPDSTLMISRPDGSAPQYPIESSDLASGTPQTVALPHGFVTIEQLPAEAQSPAPSPGADEQVPLQLTLSCQAPN